MNRVSIALLKSFITNLFLSITKILIGIIGSSQVMIADGFNSLSDLSTDIFFFFFLVISFAITGIKEKE